MLIHDSGGSGITNGLFDPIPFDEDGNYDDTRLISRIYLEYCENGDAKGLLARWVKKGGTPSEEWYGPHIHSSCGLNPTFNFIS